MIGVEDGREGGVRPRTSSAQGARCCDDKSREGSRQHARAGTAPDETGSTFCQGHFHSPQIRGTLDRPLVDPVDLGRGPAWLGFF